MNYEGFKYNLGKSPNYYNNENENKYMSKSKTNNYFSRHTDKSKDSRFNYNSERKEMFVNNSFLNKIKMEDVVEIKSIKKLKKEVN